jgi:hypothetical protein
MELQEGSLYSTELQLRRLAIGTYKYQKLPGRNSIRVLHLLPGKHDQALQGSLANAPLDAPGAYEAISYTWGSDSKTQILLTSERTIGLTDSLYSALKRLRLPSTSRCLWADALCINQDDK